MKQINIEGLPEHVVRSIEEMVDNLRKDYDKREEHSYEQTRVEELPRVSGTVIGSLSRRDIYDDAR